MLPMPLTFTSKAFSESARLSLHVASITPIKIGQIIQRPQTLYVRPDLFTHITEIWSRQATSSLIYVLMALQTPLVRRSLRFRVSEEKLMSPKKNFRFSRQ